MFVLHMFRCSFIYSQVFDTTDEFDSDADSDTDVRLPLQLCAELTHASLL